MLTVAAPMNACGLQHCSPTNSGMQKCLAWGLQTVAALRTCFTLANIRAVMTSANIQDLKPL
jgi:hypothetical protein